MATIKSLLDSDLYKFTMSQAMFHRFPWARAKYKFKNRSAGVDLRPYRSEIIAELGAYSKLRMEMSEIAYLQSLGLFEQDYLDFLFRFRPDFSQLTITEDMDIYAEGPAHEATFWELAVLPIVSEVYFRKTTNEEERWAEATKRLAKKIDDLSWCPSIPQITEFGTRRRFSAEMQEHVLVALSTKRSKNYLGTSNVYLAQKHGHKCFGTMAHEWLQLMQAFYPLHEFQKAAFENWMQEYRGKLGIALTDIVGMDAFLRDFDLLFAKAYDGVRHDSGCPYEWTDKVLAFYKDKGIDPRTKKAVYSDGLNFDKMIDLSCRYQGEIQQVFGIGTFLTNDTGVDALQLVMKLIEVDGQPVAKVSDTPGKTMCEDEVYLAHLRKTFGLP